MKILSTFRVLPLALAIAFGGVACFSSNVKQESNSASAQALLDSADSKGYIALTTDEKRLLLKKRDRAFQALDEKVRDPFISKGPDDYYYLTGTTAGSHWGDVIGIRLWRSKDLAEWEDLGFVWDLYKDGKAQNSWHFGQKLKRKDIQNVRAIWAPEIHYMKGTWWVPHCMNIGGHGLLRSKTGLPEGPYEALPPIAKTLIDGHIFEDGDDVYYAWQADYIAKMDKDMVKLVEEPIQLEHDGNHEMAYEGVLIMKIGDKYLHIGSGRYGYEPTDTYDLFYAVGDNIKGPYGKRRMALKNAGHGNIFKGPDGKWWATAFDHEYTTTIDKKNRWSTWLVPIEIEVKDDDVIFTSLDDRFQPNAEDIAFVKKLAKTGKPEAWKGVPPWTKPSELEQARARKKESH